MPEQTGGTLEHVLEHAFDSLEGADIGAGADQSPATVGLRLDGHGLVEPDPAAVLVTHPILVLVATLPVAKRIGPNTVTEQGIVRVARVVERIRKRGGYTPGNREPAVDGMREGRR